MVSEPLKPPRGRSLAGDMDTHAPGRCGLQNPGTQMTGARKARSDTRLSQVLGDVVDTFERAYLPFKYTERFLSVVKQSAPVSAFQKKKKRVHRCPIPGRLYLGSSAPSQPYSRCASSLQQSPNDSTPLLTLLPLHRT
ncbi:hypothetical protein Y1Q_0009891 [Alligator mississippiensis]|uniref:Uncharacterized protein n=1 Tax=Alligator mississippiensis TaxID=8496 RepID=A0A151MX60_ALLMI|nr:hypothetical protein Y1Q_0009891 [Alligator mississippiensis]